MRLSEDVFTYFKGMAAGVGVPSQTLINRYRRDCITRHRQVQIAWPAKQACCARPPASQQPADS